MERNDDWILHDQKTLIDNFSKSNINFIMVVYMIKMFPVYDCQTLVSILPRIRQ